MSTEPIILLADDHAEERETIAFHLAMAGFPVVQASTVEGVVDELRRARPDLVVMSDDLGDRTVHDLLALIARQPDAGDVPVITLSDDPGGHRLAESLSQGARDHIRRQAGAEELIARIDAVIRTDDELERLRRRNAELEFLGAVDALTGMANRRGLEEELDRMTAAAVRHALPLSVVMARADLPQTHHPEGTPAERDEALLRELGYLVAAVRRTDDFSGVWDRRTFAILLPLTPLEGAKVLAERLRAAVAAAPLRYRDELIGLTMSCAFAEVGAEAADVLPALEAAVHAMETAGGDAVGPA